MLSKVGKESYGDLTSELEYQKEKENGMEHRKIQGLKGFGLYPGFPNLGYLVEGPYNTACALHRLPMDCCM